MYSRDREPVNSMNLDLWSQLGGAPSAPFAAWLQWRCQRERPAPETGARRYRAGAIAKCEEDVTIRGVIIVSGASLSRPC